MHDLSFAIVIASLHGRTGKTLLARIIAEYFFLSGEQPRMFDTDVVDHRLRTLFPDAAEVVDLSQEPQQITLFDALVKASSQSRLVDLSHRSFDRFFDLMQQTDFLLEARANRVEPVILYIPDHWSESLEAGAALGRRFPDCAFVVVDNAYLPRPRELTRHGDAYRALQAHDLRLTMQPLAAEGIEALEEPSLSLSDFMRRPLSHGSAARLPEDLRQVRAQLRSWIVALLQEIHRMTLAVAGKARARAADPAYS